MDTTNSPTYRDYLNVGFTPLLCKGYHPRFNPDKDYKVAKEPVSRGWTSPDYTPPAIKEISGWENDGGWVGWLIPEGYIALDNEDKEGLALQDSIYEAQNVNPAVHMSNNGCHDFFRTPKNAELRAQSEVYTRCGIKVTYRVGGKNYLILAPTNERRWDVWKPFDQLPILPEELLPYDRKDAGHVLNCLAWAVRKARQEGSLSGYEDIDQALIALLIECRLSDEQIHSAFQVIFSSEYDERRTSQMIDRTRQRMEAQDPVIGAGSFMRKAEGLDLKEITRFVRELQTATGQGRVTIGRSMNGGYRSDGSYGSPNSDLDLIAAVPFPFEVLPELFTGLVQGYATGLQVEPELVALTMMVVMSGAIGNTIRVSPKTGWRTPPFLWAAVVKETGYGQSPAQDAILRPVRLLQAKDSDRYKSDLKAHREAMKKAEKDDVGQSFTEPRATRKLVSNITIEALADVFEQDGRGTILDKDELSGFVSSFNQYKAHGGDDRQVWLNLFNCEPLTLDRKSGGSRFIRNTGIAIIGGIQSKILPSVFSERAFDDGLLPRFLLLRAEKKTVKFNRQGISDRDRDGWENLVERCYEIPCELDEYGFIRPKIFSLADNALDLWEGFYNEYGSIQPFLSEKARVFVPKLQSYYSLKFAGILHVLNALSSGTQILPAISEDVVNGAIMLTRFFMWHAVNALKLYCGEGQQFNEYQKRLINTLYAVRGELKNGKVPLDRITKTLNETLPEKLQIEPETVANMLKEMKLTTKKSTGNYSYLIWEQEKIEKLFSQLTVTTVTTVTDLTLPSTSYESAHDWQVRVLNERPGSQELARWVKENKEEDGKR